MVVCIFNEWKGEVRDEELIRFEWGTRREENVSIVVEIFIRIKVSNDE